MKFIITENQYDRLLLEQRILPTRKVDCEYESSSDYRPYQNYLNELSLSKSFEKDLAQLHRDTIALYNKCLKEKGVHNEYDKYYVNGLFSDYGFDTYEEAKKLATKYLDALGLIFTKFFRKYTSILSNPLSSSIKKTYKAHFHHPYHKHKEKRDNKFYNAFNLYFNLYNFEYVLQPIECEPKKVVNNLVKPKPRKKVVKPPVSNKKPPISNFSQPSPPISPVSPKPIETPTEKIEPIKTNFFATFGQDGKQETRYFKTFDEWKKFYDSVNGKFGFVNGRYNNYKTEASVLLKGTPEDWGL